MGYYSNFYSAQAMAVILQGLEDLIESLLNGVKIYTTLEMTMIGLERCEAVTKIQTERKPKNDQSLVLKKNKWPNKGKINFIEYFTSYRPDTPEILKNINDGFHGSMVYYEKLLNREEITIDDYIEIERNIAYKCKMEDSVFKMKKRTCDYCPHIIQK